MEPEQNMATATAPRSPRVTACYGDQPVNHLNASLDSGAVM
jgi:hypothetical protein